MIDADVVAIHFNLAQEALQPDGDPLVSGAMERLSSLTHEYDLIAKEVGCGMDIQTSLELTKHGFKAIDVSGTSGTSFTAVESLRAREIDPNADWGTPFRDWGIPSPAALLDSSKTGLPLIASGGVRNGVDCAKALVLGASLVGMAGSVLPYASNGPDALRTHLESVIHQMRVAIFLAGGTSALKPTSSRPIFLPPLIHWVN